ncbi:hypothetical protein CBOM_07706 [Ceraceosorus bombacis]|uniref:Uncharacterized protein n=1 Tax=Ceraceosorus bombacis TaxID=401625 RepID=A0A0P1BGX7_9BASI|nr:hypothetical protein CBOM_07706 [Ceraceosorus bombacis]
MHLPSRDLKHHRLQNVVAWNRLGPFASTYLLYSTNLRALCRPTTLQDPTRCLLLALHTSPTLARTL